MILNNLYHQIRRTSAISVFSRTLKGDSKLSTHG
jgi:hypothetical protein